MEQLIEQFAENIVTWIGVPYLHRGTTRRGVDCTGLIIGSMKELSFISDYALRQYPHDWNIHGGAGDFIREEIGAIANEISPKTSAEKGDLVLFRFGKCAAHIGVYQGGDMFVHSIFGAHCVRWGRLKSSKWMSRWIHTYRIDVNKVLRMKNVG